MDYRKLFEPYVLDYSKDKKDLISVMNKGNEALELLKEVYNNHYGSIEEDENLISIHTGGWSENEEIISEFKRTAWWFINYYGETIGGHYFFNTKKFNGKQWRFIKQDN